MRKVTVTAPSFPAARANELLSPAERETWQVLCGDAGHWRVGFYSPASTRASDLAELEQHDCPELFLLLRGELTLLLAEGGSLCEVALEPGRPLLVTAPHGGFCPQGPHAGVAVVVERDRFTTTYRSLEELRSR